MARRTGWLTLLILTLLLPSRSEACSIPVFRFALERWSPAQYEVVVFHRGGLSGPTSDLLGRFHEAGRDANVKVRAIDLDGKVETNYQRLWEKNESRTLPWMVVRFPDADDKSTPLWTGAVTEESVTALIDSPIRQKLARHLTQGDSAVFLLLTSGNKEADEAAEDLVRRESSRLQEKVKLPEQSNEGPQLTLKLPVKVSFPVVVVSRQSEAERFLVQMLLRGDEDLTKVAGPILFPIFGRGRMLYSYHGDDLQPERLERVAQFLCSACSCRVKEDIPCVDLLIACAWEDQLAAASGLASQAVFEKIPAPYVEDSEQPARLERYLVEPKETNNLVLHVKHSNRNWLWAAIAVAAVLTLATGIWVVRKSLLGKQ
jgi:hypothetical protein